MIFKKAITILFLLACSFLSFAQDKYSEVELTITDHKQMHTLIDQGFDLDHSDASGDKIRIFCTPEELTVLSKSRIPFEITIDNYRKYYKDNVWEPNPVLRNNGDPNVSNHFSYGSMGGFYTLAEIEDKLDSMNILYPSIASQKYSIGTSIEGREIYAVKISDNHATDEAEPAAYFDALHHAREPAAMATTINFMFWLLENYSTDPLVAYLVDNRELYFVPCVNPDGYEYNRQTDPNGGGMWRKNRRNISNSSCYGVDLNRNYSFGYAANGSCSSGDPCSNTYKGTSPFSEPESQAVRDFLAVINPSTAFSTHFQCLSTRI